MTAIVATTPAIWHTVSTPMIIMYLCHSWSEAVSTRARNRYQRVLRQANTRTVMYTESICKQESADEG